MKAIIPKEIIEQRILLLRGRKVILDRDIAELYGVPNKVLNQAVKRNIERFPADFMFQLTGKEFRNWKSQFVTSNSGDKMGLRKNHMLLLSKELRCCPACLIVPEPYR